MKRGTADMIVNFEFLGREPMENVITCMNFKIDKVVFFGYQETIQEQGKNADHFLRKYCGVQEIVFLPLSREDLQAVLKTMREAIEEELQKQNLIYFDITGGESLLLVAFGMLSKEFETPMHQYDIPGNRLIELDEGAGHCISKDVPTQQVTLNLDRYIEMRGSVINHALHKDAKNIENEEFAKDIERIWEVAKNNWDYWNPFSDFLRAHMVPDENMQVNCSTNDILKALNASLNSLHTPKMLNYMLDELAKAGVLLHMEHQKGRYQFQFKNEAIKSCLWESGSILELHIYQEEKAQGGECMNGVFLDWDGIIHLQAGADVLNEVDVLSLHGNVPTFISCKSGKVNGPQALRALYELQTVADRFGGKYAKKRLVTAQSLGERYLERAEEMGIEIRSYTSGTIEN
jgi:hypothetical protein